MADNVTYSKIVELLDNSQYLAALKKAEEEEKLLTSLRIAGGQAAVKAYRDTERAAKAAARGPSEWTTALNNQTAASKSTTQGMQQLSFQLNDVITQLASGTPVAQVFAQQGGQIAQQFQMTPGLFGSLAAGVSAFGSALGTVAIPFLSVAGPLLLDYRAAAEAAADGQTALNDAMEAADPLYSRALDDLKKLSDLRRGSMTVDERKAEIEAVYGEELKTTNEALAEQIALDEAWLSTNSASQAGWQERTNNVKRLTAEMKANEERSAAGVEAAKILIDFQDEEERSSRALADAKEREAEARKRAAEAKRLEAEEAAFLSGILSQLEGWHPLDGLTTMDKAGLFDNVETFEEAQIRMAKAAEKRAQAVLDLEAQIREEQKKTRQSAIDGTESLIGVYADAADAIADATAESGGKAAQSAFLASQALGYSQAAISALKTGGEVAAALAPVLGPAAIPAGVAAGAAALAAFAIPIASQEPPQFAYNDTPGVMQVGSSRQDVNFKEGDLFLAAQSMDGLTSQLGAMLSSQAGNQTRRPRRSRLRDRLAIDPLAIIGLDIPRAIRGGAR